MSETTIRDLFRNLEATLHERLRTIEDVMRFGSGGTGAGASSTDSKVTNQAIQECEQRMYTRNLALQSEIHALREEVGTLRKELAECRKTAACCVPAPAELIPQTPLRGIEIVPKREIVISDVMSIENRLLLNKVARKALEAKEMGEDDLLDRAAINSDSDGDEHEKATDVEEEAAEEAAEEEAAEEEAAEEAAEEEAEEEEEVVAEEEEEEELVEEEEAEEEEAAEEEEEEEEAAEEEEAEVELEEFEYKGSTYYRDGDGNVFMTDEDGELMEDPIGIWSEVKQRIIVKKVAA